MPTTLHSPRCSSAFATACGPFIVSHPASAKATTPKAPIVHLFILPLLFDAV
jgi:hypothetical protein